MIDTWQMWFDVSVLYGNNWTMVVYVCGGSLESVGSTVVRFCYYSYLLLCCVSKTTEFWPQHMSRWFVNYAIYCGLNGNDKVLQFMSIQYSYSAQYFIIIQHILWLQEIPVVNVILGKNFQSHTWSWTMVLLKRS